MTPSTIRKFDDCENVYDFCKFHVELILSDIEKQTDILNYVDIDSKEEMLGYGVGIILLNVSIYAIMPVVVIFRIKNFY